jgi:putative addiction module component (TIGR02574 family)
MILDRLPAVRALAPEEQWQLLDELWKELARAAESAAPDAATIALLERREAEYEADREAVQPWAEVQARLSAHKQACRAVH